jgi:hypothetical protein
MQGKVILIAFVYALSALGPYPLGHASLVTLPGNGYWYPTDTTQLLRQNESCRESCEIGGTLATPYVAGNIDPTQCATFTLLLGQQTSSTSTGRIYVGLQLPSVSEWGDYLWFRPSNSKSPPYVQLAKTDAGFLPNAGDLEFQEGPLGSEDLAFEIGVSGLERQTIVFEILFLANGMAFNEENLEVIQHVEINLDNNKMISADDLCEAYIELYYRGEIELPGLMAVSFAQWMLESGWCESELARNAYNFGGLKDREEVKRGGTYCYNGEAYERFYNPEAFILGYWEFMDRKPYEKFNQNKDQYEHDPEGFIETIGSTYNPEDKEYVEKVLDIYYRRDFRPYLEKLVLP